MNEMKKGSNIEVVDLYKLNNMDSFDGYYKITITHNDGKNKDIQTILINQEELTELYNQIGTVLK